MSEMQTLIRNTCIQAVVSNSSFTECQKELLIGLANAFGEISVYNQRQLYSSLRLFERKFISCGGSYELLYNEIDKIKQEFIKNIKKER